MKSLIRHTLHAFQQSINDVLPDLCVQKALSVNEKILTVNGESYHLNNNVHIVAFGKAACKMVEGAERILGVEVVGGIASIPIGSTIPINSKINFYTGAENNLPDENSIKNTQLILDYIRKIRDKENIILFLISGGGSALLSLPLEGITLEHKLSTISTLTKAGADIKQLNLIRSALSNVKGGKLAKFGFPSKMIGLIMSDVIGDTACSIGINERQDKGANIQHQVHDSQNPLKYIASGPTVINDQSSTQDQLTPLDVVCKLNATDKIPKSVLSALTMYELSGKCADCFSHPYEDVNNLIVGDNSLLLASLAKNLEKTGTKTLILTKELDGNASSLGEKFAASILHLSPSNSLQDSLPRIHASISRDSVNMIEPGNKIYLLFGGESTVLFNDVQTVSNALGGRNQEFVLSTYLTILQNPATSRICPTNFAIFSLGTDGQDGPTDAAGAFISSDDIAAFLALTDEEKDSFIDDAKRSLISKNSYNFWTTYRNGDNLVKIGKTGNNLMDVQIIYLEIPN